MPKIVIHNIKGIMASIVSIFILFFALILFQNKTTMIVTMDTPKGTPLQSQIYFTSEGQPFSEEKSRKSFKNKNNQYYFYLPDIKTIQYTRFDPASSINTITISKIVFIQSTWFKRTIFELDVENLEPISQINNYEKTIKGVKFSSVGNDPQFNMHFALKHISTAKTIHLSLFLISILIFIVCLYLYTLYKTKELNDFLVAKLILYSLIFALLLFKVNYYKENIRFAYPPDELAHLAYINYVHDHHEILPTFENMVMLNNKQAGNYLSHPPLYYKIMDIVFDKNYSIIKNVDNFRTLSMIIFIASFLLLLYLGFNSKISLLGHFVYLSVISSVPMYAYVGASITNDTLAILGGIIFILGLKQILEKDYTNLTYSILAIGIFIAYFSKLTVALLIFFASIYFFIYIIRFKTGFKITKGQFILLIVILIPIFSYQFYILSHYHSLVPTFNLTYPEQYLKSGFFVPEEFRQHLSYMEWIERIKNNIIGGWFGIHSHHSFVKNSVFEYMGLLLLHIFAIAALFLKCEEENKSYCIIGKFALLALFSVLIVQYIFSYQTHLKSGYLGGLQPRYVLPFMFSFAIMSSIFVERFKQFFLFNIFIILICIHAIYSDFFYFLQYYQ